LQAAIAAVATVGATAVVILLVWMFAKVALL
jgi:hypothetical protein